MFNGKMKAVTFSYDDGVTQDIRLIELLNKYKLKSTFMPAKKIAAISAAVGSYLTDAKQQMDKQ